MAEERSTEERVRVFAAAYLAELLGHEDVDDLIRLDGTEVIESGLVTTVASYGRAVGMTVFVVDGLNIMVMGPPEPMSAYVCGKLKGEWEWTISGGKAFTTLAELAVAINRFTAELAGGMWEPPTLSGSPV